MSAAESIKTILSEQVTGYRALLDILQQERICLLSFNPLGVETLAKEKDTIVMKLKLLEEERIRLVCVYASEQALADADVFRSLAETSGDDSFQRLRLQLISLLQSIMELNGFNRVLIERSAAVIKNALNFLGSSGMTATAARTGALLSREV
jgi:flagellar biosynthesis/type III secretory pathway chaperone